MLAGLSLTLSEIPKFFPSRAILITACVLRKTSSSKRNLARPKACTDAGINAISIQISKSFRLHNKRNDINVSKIASRVGLKLSSSKFRCAQTLGHPR